MKPDARAIFILARRELREATRRRWLWVYTASLVVLTIGLSLAGTRAAGYAGLGGFGRTSASLVNALLLFIPLLGLSIGSVALLADGERGSLSYLLAQPITRTDLFLGKFLGSAIALSLSVGLAFGFVTFLLLSAGATSAGLLGRLLLVTFLFALASLALGFLVGALARTQASAMAATLGIWLTLAFFADAAFVMSTFALRPTPGTMLALLLANPAQVYKLGALHGLQGDLSVLGPLGVYATHEFGEWLVPLLMSLLAAWALAASLAAFLVFARRSHT